VGFHVFEKKMFTRPFSLAANSISISVSISAVWHRPYLTTERVSTLDLDCWNAAYSLKLRWLFEVLQVQCINKTHHVNLLVIVVHANAAETAIMVIFSLYKLQFYFLRCM